MLLFSFVGFEAAAIGAEEARAAQDLPIATVGSALAATVVYFCMSFSLVLMVPVAAIGTDPALPGAAAFSSTPFTQSFRAVGGCLQPQERNSTGQKVAGSFQHFNQLHMHSRAFVSF